MEDHLCIPGLTRPVTVSEYAKLKGIREAEVLAAIRALKIRSAYSNGQWYIEAPRNCEAQLAQLRAERPTPVDSRGKTGTMKQPGLPPSEPLRRDPINEEKHDKSERLRALEKERPQPIDYGLTYDDLNLYDNFSNFNSWWCRLDDGNSIQCLGTRLRPDEKYKKGRRWFRVLHPLQACAYKAGGFAFWALLFGGLMMSGKESRLVGLVLVGFGLACVVCAIVPGVLLKRLRARASPGLIAYWQAVHHWNKEKAAVEEAARAAARDAELRKRSYWAFLDGYAFERATAEVMQKHQFTALVTPGSGDGGVDIQVTRNGLKGVVQCKAHVACVGPHVVRDLYGVIHHCGASFGIIVSRGGFTRGAVEFARDKPILFLDTDDLIAMQEGRDVLAAAFAPRDANTASQQQ